MQPVWGIVLSQAANPNGITGVAAEHTLRTGCRIMDRKIVIMSTMKSPAQEERKLLLTFFFFFSIDYFLFSCIGQEVEDDVMVNVLPLLICAS